MRRIDKRRFCFSAAHRRSRTTGKTPQKVMFLHCTDEPWSFIELCATVCFRLFLRSHSASTSKHNTVEFFSKENNRGRSRNVTAGSRSRPQLVYTCIFCIDTSTTGYTVVWEIFAKSYLASAKSTPSLNRMINVA